MQYEPFSITQYTNDKVSSRTANSPYFENGDKSAASSNDDTCFAALRDRAQKRSGVDIYGQDTDSIKQSVSWGFWLPGEEQTLFGIPEREDTLALKTTTGTDPYQIYATDHLHAPNETGPLYGSIPYIMGLSHDTATSFLWVNSAKTTVDIDRGEDKSEKKGTQVTFASEANVIEFFMFTNGDKE